MAISPEKSIILLGNFLSGLIFGLLPLVLISLAIKRLFMMRKKPTANADTAPNMRHSEVADFKHRWETIICNVNSFSGGVFVGIFFLRLYPKFTKKMSAVLPYLG